MSGQLLFTPVVLLVISL